MIPPEWPDEAEAVPDGTWHRSVLIPCEHRTCPDGTLVAHLLTPDEGPPDAHLLHRAAQLVTRGEALLDVAEAHLAAEVAAAPERFGWTADDVAAADQDGRPLATEPAFTFGEAETWSIHFAEGRLPICEPYGVLVTMSEWEPTGVEDLSQAEEI